MKLDSHDDIFAISEDSKCGNCGELEGYTAVIEIINKASSLCLKCALDEGRLTEKQYRAGKQIERDQREIWEEAEEKRIAGEAEFLARLKASNPVQEDE